ncbi:ataxin-7-like protein 2b isoform X1 [Eucyclogobius newberryi]|uniref:ataxin-7-like protein 2b isoform X1 n=1 Tax=Eucyclogobius newberryi TaxID=166745 RepID=UPI003B5CB069
MAAVDRRMPNLDDFVGLNWSCWAATVDAEPPDAQSEDTKHGRGGCETMTLRKEDMPIYGHCPAQDDFYLVVCGHCGKLVKPQALVEHCERRHGSPAKTCAPSSSAPLQQPRATRPAQTVSKDRPRDSRLKETCVPSSSSSSSSSQRRPSKPQKEAASLPTVDKISQDKLHPALPQRPRSQPQPPLPPLPNHCRPSASASSSSSSPRPSSTKPPVQKPTNSPQRDARTYTRTLKNNNSKMPIDRKCDDQEKKKLITQQPVQTMDLNRPLKMKTESELPSMASSPRDPEPAPVKATESQGAPKEYSSRCSKYTLNNSHIARPRDPPETFPPEESPVVELEVQPPYPFNQSLPSSDNSDNEEEHTDVPATPWHPKPLGVCSFGCHAFGCSVFTFDRRLHHLRIALSAMLEDNVNSHLWKKIPPPASNLRSAHATPSTRGSPVRTGARSNPTGAFNVKSTSLERLKSIQTNSKTTKLPSSAPTLSPGPGQQSSSVVQTSKAHTGQREIMQNAKTSQKPSQLSNTTSSKHIATSNVLIPGSVSKKTPPLSPLRPTERNTPVLNESLQTSSCPSRSKGRPSRIVQSRAGSCDDRALVQKRKAQSTVAPSSSSPSKKCPRLSPPSRSSLFSWKRDSTQDVWLGVWRKEHTSEGDSDCQF